MTGVMATLAGRLVLVLLVAAGSTAEGVRTPVFRGAMGLSGRSIALFEVQGNAGTWQGEVGRTLPGTAWRIERIDLASGRVTIRAGGKLVTLGQGDTYQDQRVLKAPDPARAPGPLPRANDALPGSANQQDAMQRQLQAALSDPAVRNQLKALGLAIPPAAARSQPQTPQPQAPQPRFAPPEPTGPVIPLIRAIDASVTVPPIGGLGKPGYQTVVMLLSAADPASVKLKPRVLGLSRRPRTAVVFVDMGQNPDAPVRAAWNAGALPHFLLIDPNGGVLASGEAARTVVDSWLR